MKMKSFLLIAMAVCLMVCLCACGNDSTTDSTTKTTQTTANNTTTTTTTQTTTTTTTTVDDSKVIYTVTVTDEAGNPVPGVFVQLCEGGNCLPKMTNVQGVATYENMVEADYKVSFVQIPVGYSVETNEFHFEAGSYEMTIVVKAVA